MHKTPKKMTIVLVTTGLKMGGAERQVIELAKVFKKNHQVTIISLTKGAYYSTDDIPVFFLDITKKNLFSIIQGLFKYIKIIKKIKPDVVHSHMVGANIFTRVARLFFNKYAHISSAHSIQEGGKVVTFLYRTTDFLTDITTNVSPDAVKKYISNGLVKQNKIIYMPNGIDINQNDKYKKIDKNIILQTISKEIKSSDIIFLYIGRFNLIKDLDTMIDSFKKSKEQCDNIKLIMCGDGPEKNNIIKKIEQNNLTEDIFIIGQQKDVGLYYSVADAFLLTSTYEGMPMCILEAGIFSLPIISTDVGNIKEILYNDYPFNLCKPGNVECLASNIEKLSKMNNTDIKKIGSLIRNIIIDKYSLEVISNEWLNLYKKYL